MLHLRHESRSKFTRGEEENALLKSGVDLLKIGAKRCAEILRSFRGSDVGLSMGRTWIELVSFKKTFIFYEMVG